MVVGHKLVKRAVWRFPCAMSYRDIPKVTNRRVNTTFNNNAAAVALEASSLTPSEGSRTTRGTFTAPAHVAPKFAVPVIHVAVTDAEDGDAGLTYINGQQDPERQYISLRRVNSDGTQVEEGQPIVYQVMPDYVPPEE